VAEHFLGVFKLFGFTPGANPTTLSNNASAVKIYLATISIMRF
jgi:hypothetical protein